MKKETSHMLTHLHALGKTDYENQAVVDQLPQTKKDTLELIPVYK